MATCETLKALVAAGSDLTMLHARYPDEVVKICEIAAESGAKVTVSTEQGTDLLLELVERFKGSIAFVDHGQK